MKVAIDTSVTEVTAGGSAVYARELLAALRGLGGEDHFLEYKYHPLFKRSDRILRKADTLAREIVWQQAWLPRLARRDGADVIHAPAFLAPLRARLPLVVSILDVYLFRDPKSFPAWQSRFMRLMLPRIVERADRIIAISHFTKREILDVFPGIPESRVLVTPLGVHPRFRAPAADELSRIAAKHSLSGRPFLLSVCTLEPRKNLPRLIEALAAVRDRIDHDLVLVGAVGWKTSGLFRKVEDLGLASRVRTLGHVALEDLPALYGLADVFVCPSLYEGFGLPPLEAMACGCPVIASDTPSLVELVADAGVRVDPRDVEALAESIVALTGDRERKDLLRRAGLERARQFTWRRCAEQTRAAYEAALGN